MIFYQSCENILMRLAYFGSTSSKRAGCADVAELADAQDLGSCALVVCRFDSCHPHLILWCFILCGGTPFFVDFTPFIEHSVVSSCVVLYC